MSTSNGVNHIMIKKIPVIFCVLSAFLLFGCPPPEPKQEEGDTLCAVSDVRIDVNDKMMNVSWVNNCKQTISGYNIYINDKPLIKGKPYNTSIFDGDTNPADGRENFQAMSLENGKKYYVSVTIVYPDLSESAKSNEQLVVCAPRGEIELAVRYKSEHDGYSFVQNDYVRADNDKNDMYFFNQEGVDYLVSPDNLDGFLRKSKFVVLDYTGDFQGLKDNFQNIQKVPTESKLVISTGKWILVQLDKNKHALLKVIELSGSGEERKIKLFYAYSPISNELIF